jgi:long-subunit fatty acid transport protein
LAYQINEVFQIGAGIRIGINTFSVDDSQPSFSATLSGSSAGAGGVFGVMARAHRLVQLGAVYRTPLSTTIGGNGNVTIGQGQPTKQDFSLHIDWPQSAALAVTLFAHRRLFVTAQGDWTGWSSLQKLTIDLAGLPEVRQMRYRDTYTVHAGAQITATRFLLFRVGASVDSDALPDRTVRRENRDELKATVACGFGVHVWKLFFDGAFEAVLPFSDRVVAAPEPNAAMPENETGRYSAKVYSAELSAQIRF